MVQKLLSYLPKEIRWRLPLKAAAGVVALLLAFLFRFSFLGCLVYFTVIAFLYFSESSERKTLRVSFWTVSVLALLAFSDAASLPPLLIPSIIKVMIVLSFGAMLYFLLGLSHLAFPDRALSYRLVQSIALFFVMAEFFFFAPSLGDASFFPFFLWSAGMIILLALLFKEAFVFLGVHHRRRTVRLLSFASGFLALEVSLLVLFLPLGFISAGAFLALFLVLFRDTLIMHFEGGLVFSFVLKELTLFAVFSSILFATAPWFLP